MTWKGKPEKRRYVLNIWFNMAIKIFVIIFAVFWLCMVNVIMVQKLSSNVIDDLSAYLIPYIAGCIVMLVGIIAGIVHLYRLIKKRFSDAEMMQYEVSDQNITIMSDYKKSISLSEVKEVVVVYSWIYGSKEYGDIFFRRSEKEFLTSGINSILTKPETPKALGFIAVRNPEEAAQTICDTIQTITKCNLKYNITGLYGKAMK
jgi:hypothetical protein